jgi:hypothetical protein
MDTVTAELTEIDFAQPSAGRVPAAASAPLPPMPVVDADPVLQLIIRAASDPAVSMDKMERLLAMQDQRRAQQARDAYDAAMADAQEAMKAIRADAENSQTHSKYATYAALDHATRPIYSLHGFALSFNTGDSPRENELRVLCTVSHRGGHRQEYRIDMPADGKGARGNDVMTRTHATGAAASYGQRYLLKLIFNLAVGDVDDDGNGADGGMDDDVERLGSGPRDPATGKLRSTYDAVKAQKAQAWADGAIEYINLSNAQAAKEWCRENWRVQPRKQKSPLQWLDENAPGQFVRVNTAYLNATGEELKG